MSGHNNAFYPTWLNGQYLTKLYVPKDNNWNNGWILLLLKVFFPFR